MNNLNRIATVLFLNTFLVACGGGSDIGSTPPPDDGGETTVCNKMFTDNDVLIVDLSQNSSSGLACTMTSDREEVASCVEDRIRTKFADTPNCMAAFDVFVPGTNAENGDFKQFTSIMSTTPGRTYLSLQYSDNSDIFDAINYDKGVSDASNALNDLLYTLKTRFNKPDIRVFGHSKGSDSTARVSTYNAHADVDFFAFAQPGRTPKTVRGTPGNIHKLSDNLVGITWQNDEVKFYNGGSTGYQVPEIWGFPGYINQTSGGMTVNPLRIDHHNNYGGDYIEKNQPYCATGNKAAMVATAECKKQDDVAFVPYFWGNEECTNKAFTMMNNATVGDKHYIGYSGPRADDCKDTVSNIKASYELVYRINIADQDDCKYNMQLSFQGLDFGTNRSNGGNINVSSTRDTSWLTKRGTIELPLHMRLGVSTSMQDVSGPISKCINYLDAKSESYIDKLNVTFKHPDTGLTVKRTLIGNAEGVEYFYPQKVTGKNNVGWRKQSGSWDMHYGIPPSNPTHGGALMVKGKTGGGYKGNFYKWLHLID